MLRRKPNFKKFEEFKRTFEKINDEAGLNQQLIPYFISSHPGCREEDMAELAAITKKLNFHLEQVQDFTPTPMTLSTEIYYTISPLYGRKNIYSPQPKREIGSKAFFSGINPINENRFYRNCKEWDRPDLINRLYGPPIKNTKTETSSKTKYKKKKYK